MENDFDAWNQQKQRLHAGGHSRLYSEREIWWCAFGVNIGFEQNGTGPEYQRPMLILRGMSRDTCYVVPLSTSPKKHKYRIPVGKVDGKQAVALLSQIRLVDTKRLVNKVGYLDREVFRQIRKAAKDLL